MQEIEFYTNVISLSFVRTLEIDTLEKGNRNKS